MRSEGEAGRGGGVRRAGGVRHAEAGPVAREFEAVLREHDALLEAFLEHRAALLDRDLPRARERLAAFRRFLERHSGAEDEVLLPLWLERGGEEPGSTRILYDGEHAKLHALLHKIEGVLAEVPATEPARTRAVIDLLDLETMFKHLFDHHATREKSLFFPRMTALTAPEERAALMARFEETKRRIAGG